MPLLYGNAADSEVITGEENFVPNLAPELQGSGNYTVDPGIEENLVRQTPVIGGTSYNGSGAMGGGISGNGFIDNTPVRGVSNEGGGPVLGVSQGATVVARPYIPMPPVAPNINISTPVAIPMATPKMPTFATAQANPVAPPTPMGATLNPIAPVPTGPQIGGGSAPMTSFNGPGPSPITGLNGNGTPAAPFQLSAQAGPEQGAGAQQVAQGEGTPAGPGSPMGGSGPMPSGGPPNGGPSNAPPPSWMGSFQQAFTPAAKAFHGFIDQLAQDPVGALLGGAEAATQPQSAEAANIQPRGGLSGGPGPTGAPPVSGGNGAPPAPKGTPVAPMPASVAHPAGAPAQGRTGKLIAPPKAIPLSLDALTQLSQIALSDAAKESTDAQVFGSAAQSVKDNVNLARAVANLADQQHFTNANDVDNLLTHTLKQWYQGDPGDPAKGIPPTPAVFKQIHANIYKPLTDPTIRLDQGTPAFPGAPADPANGTPAMPPRDAVPPGPARSRKQVMQMLEGYAVHLSEAGTDMIDDANKSNDWAKKVVNRPMPDYAPQGPQGRVPNYDSKGNLLGYLNEEIRQNVNPDDLEPKRQPMPQSNTLTGRLMEAWANHKGNKLLKEAFPDTDITLTKAWANAKGSTQKARELKAAEYHGDADQALKIHKATLDERGAAGGVQDMIKGYREMFDKAELAEQWAKTFLYQQLVLEMAAQNTKNQERSLGLKGQIDARLIEQNLALEEQKNTIQQYLNDGQLAATRGNTAANIFNAQVNYAKEQDAQLRDQATQIEKDMAAIRAENNTLKGLMDSLTPAKGGTTADAQATKKIYMKQTADNIDALIALHKTYDHVTTARGKVFTTLSPEELAKKAKESAGTKPAATDAHTPAAGSSYSEEPVASAAPGQPFKIGARSAIWHDKVAEDLRYDKEQRVNTGASK